MTGEGSSTGKKGANVLNGHDDPGEGSDDDQLALPAPVSNSCSPQMAAVVREDQSADCYVSMEKSSLPDIVSQALSSANQQSVDIMPDLIRHLTEDKSHVTVEEARLPTRQQRCRPAFRLGCLYKVKKKT
jgi:hypothetical protein